MHESLAPYEALVESGHLKRSRKDGLILYGYTDHCTFERNWNQHTRTARGLIFVEETGELVARPFPKFFNLGEMEETRLENLPNEQYLIWEKVDGSLGIIFHYEGEWRVATRGSLSSDQAIRGQEILKKYDLSNVNKGLTLLVEIIYPENRIICDYGQEEMLVLLGANLLDPNKEMPAAGLPYLADTMGMPIAKYYNYSIKQAIELAETLPKLEEGFVVQYESGFRVKIKGKEYMKIAKIISNLSPISFWETMENGVVPKAYLEQIPEEFRGQWEHVVSNLQASYQRLLVRTKGCLDSCPVDYRNPKELGTFMQTRPDFFPVPGLVWPLLKGDSDRVDKLIMRTIRPDGNALKSFE
jgi:RNA ligase